ncbi:MAG: SUMF1/EgtB/PvdO family nonheme iron enzyme [Bacteroidaceae bacterium]|nr:SUMF1/EgtB/PvdO family nonheme iron enzyme [Bacteroidaceae bacterium]
MNTKPYHIFCPLLLGTCLALLALAFTPLAQPVHEVQSDGAIVLHFQSLPQVRLKRVPAGTFTMGVPAKSSEAQGDEMPAHTVDISAFNLMRTEVSQEFWMAVMNDNPSYHVGDDLPVENVSWNDAQEFIARLNQHPEMQSEKLRVRLPSEAEWEYVASGAANGLSMTRYAGSNDPDAVAWYAQNSDGQTHPVGQLQDIAPGFYDLSGNVAEWVADRYCEYSSHPQRNPLVNQGPSVFVYRGGSFRDNSKDLRVTARFADTATYRADNLGFRLVYESR